MKKAATRVLPGPAWAELDDVVVGARPDAEILIVMNEPVDFDAFPRLRLVANFSVGYDRIDVEACRRRGIAVTNTPGVLDAAVADLTFALILAVRRRVVEGDARVRAGGWGDPGFVGREVSGATIAVVGMGRIGAAVARRAEGFDMRVVGLSSRSGDLDAALREADVVSLHTPLNDATRGLISRDRLALLRDGTTLVNTARGAVVDEEALVDELVSGRIDAGLDVFVHEPHVPERLRSLANVVLTPHIASATVETRAAMTRCVVENVLAFERGEPLPTPVVAPHP
ncbi:MAG TPA: D-glycerate dehydrogenase [Gaiellaceae bacterium]|nr:D-glycerate dehydrogenase [Gaiellaceae bacterium]